MVHTTPRQQAFSALAAGMTLDDLASMRRYEEGYIARQMERDMRKTKAFMAHYPGGTHEFLEAYGAFKPREAIATRFEDKQPIFIGGASGSTWKNLKTHEQGQIEQMMDLLVRALDPKKVFFVIGRVQNEGVTKALDIAVKRHNIVHPENRFQVYARLALAKKDEPTGELPESVSRIEVVDGGLDAVVDDVADYARRNDAKSLVFAGSQFTGDMVQAFNDVDAGPVRFAAYMPTDSELERRIGCVTQDHLKIASLNDFIDRILVHTGEHALFRDASERDAMMRPEVTMDNPEYRQALLEDVHAVWKKGAHVEKSKGRSRSAD
jgi:hypothetical protein